MDFISKQFGWKNKEVRRERAALTYSFRRFKPVRSIAVIDYCTLYPGGGGGLPYETDGDARRLA